TVIDYRPSTDAGALAPSHTYIANGLYTVTLTVQDDDTGTASVTKTVSVVAVALEDDPLAPGQLALYVGGTTADDSVVLSPSGNTGAVQVSINGVSQGAFAAQSRLVVYGQDGNDDIQVAGSVSQPAWLYGGNGNDRLNGGRGNNVLLGGDG